MIIMKKFFDLLNNLVQLVLGIVCVSFLINKPTLTGINEFTVVLLIFICLAIYYRTLLKFFQALIRRNVDDLRNFLSVKLNSVLIFVMLTYIVYSSTFLTLLDMSVIAMYMVCIGFLQRLEELDKERKPTTNSFD